MKHILLTYYSNMEGRVEIVIEKVFKIFKIEKVFKIIPQYFEGLCSPSASKYITYVDADSHCSKTF